MAAKKELSNHDFNETVFKEIKVLENKINDLKATLKPLKLVENLPLHECNKQQKSMMAKVK